jgi:hypothetical protein
MSDSDGQHQLADIFYTRISSKTGAEFALPTPKLGRYLFAEVDSQWRFSHAEIDICMEEQRVDVSSE